MDIFAVLRAEANTEKAPAMEAYMRNQFSFLGIPTPKRRKLTRYFLKSLVSQPTVDWCFVHKCWEEPEREFQYLAKGYLEAVKHLLTDSDIPTLRQLAITKSWWDTVDGLDTIVGDIAHRYPQVNEILLQWSQDENIWLRRIAINHQRGRKTETDTRLLEKIIVNNFGQKDFFINKAIGWSLRDYSKSNPDWVRAFITQHRDKMAALSIREASKYI